MLDPIATRKIIGFS